MFNYSELFALRKRTNTTESIVHQDNMKLRTLTAQNISLNERVKIYEHLIEKSGLLKTMLDIEQMIKKNRVWNGYGDFTYAHFTDGEITNILDLLHSAVDKIHAAHPTNYTGANTGANK